MEQPCISIIVPVYNMASDNKLEYCITSLLRQTMENYEIIAVDDASTDNSLEILRTFEKQYPKVLRVIASKENHHQGGARNLGIKAARGIYIGMMDSDDWAAPDMYEKLWKKAVETGAEDIPAKSMMELSVVLRQADMVKFAKAEPDAEQNEQNYLRAYYFVEETKRVEQTSVEGKQDITIETKIDD